LATHPGNAEFTHLKIIYLFVKYSLQVSVIGARRLPLQPAAELHRAGNLISI